MIRELINFTKSLDDDFKNAGLKLGKGLHILVDKLELTGELEIVDYYYNWGNSDDTNPFLNDYLFYEKNSQYITMNKVQKFDP